MKAKDSLNFISILLLMLTSAVPFFMAQIQYIIIGLAISLINLILNTKKWFDLKFLFFIIAIFLCQMIQGYTNNEVFVSTYLGTILRFFWIYMIIRSAKVDYLRYVVKIMYFFSVISLFFYVSMIAVPDLKSVYHSLSSSFNFYVFPVSIEDLSDLQNFHIIIYNFHGYDYASQSNAALAQIRNCGPFWEPGIFAGYLIITLAFLYFSEGTVKNKRGYVFIAALITTFSTTGYLALMISLAIFFSDYIKKYKIILVPALIVGIYMAFFNLAFLSNKISDQSKQLDQDKSRFGSALRDLAFFIQNPLWGEGRNADSAYGRATSGDDAETNNGITSVLAGLGLVYFLIFSGMVIYSYKRLGDNINKKYVSWPLYLVFLIISFSEVYFVIPFFMSLSFLYVIADSKYQIGERKLVKKKKFSYQYPAEVRQLS